MMLTALAEKAARWAAKRRELGLVAGSVRNGAPAACPEAPYPRRVDSEEYTPPRRERTAVGARQALSHDAASARSHLTYKDIAGEQELDLIAAFQGGDRRAGEVLLKAHERAIEHWAVKTAKWSNLDPDECRQEAAIGFLHAAKIYDPSRGAKFITMALPWVRQAVERWAQDNARTIRLPVNQQVALIKARRGEEHHVTQNGKRYVVKPREEALAFFGVHLPSLDAPVGDDDGSTLGQILPDGSASPEAEVIARDAWRRRAHLVERATRGLSAQELEVLTRRHLADEPETLEEIGDSWGRSRERVWQVEAKALDKMRAELRVLGVEQKHADLWSDT